MQSTQRISVRGAGAVLAVFLSVPLVAAATPDTALSPIRVSEDGRSFVVDGEPFLWLADAPSRPVTALDRVGVERYLDERAEQGTTVVRTPVTPAPNAYGDVPAGVDGTPAVTPGADPADPAAYDYWDHLDYVVAAAADRGIRVALAPGRGDGAYGEFVGERLGADVVWVLGDSGAAPLDMARWNDLARGIALGSGVAPSEPVMTFESRKPSTEWFDDAEWLSFTSVPQGACGTENDLFAQFVNPRERVRPLLDGGANADCTGPLEPLAVRRDAYADVFAGAAGHTLDATRSPEGAAQLRHLRALVGSRPFLTRVPAPEVLTSGATGTRALRDADDGYLMVHAPAGEEFSVNTAVLPGEALRGWWYDPRTGTPIDTGTVMRGESVAFFPPTTGPEDAGLDWVLVVDDAARGFAPPGRLPSQP